MLGWILIIAAALLYLWRARRIRKGPRVVCGLCGCPTPKSEVINTVAGYVCRKCTNVKDW